MLASGDLTDAKDSDHLGSRQYELEWRTYRNIVDATVESKTVWLDIRGNHDNFNVAGDNAETNFFRKYSVQGGANPRSYLRQIRIGSERYSFIAIDACLDPGPKRPFNFIGVLSSNDTDHIVRLAEQARRDGGNYTIWFGHYPTSCIVSMGTGSAGLRHLIGQYDEGFAYLCGHLHKLGGMVPRMYTLQNEGFLELELGDWKMNRSYRLAAIDHGLFSFVDVQHGEWPIVLVTNPKHALYHLPSKEHPRLQRASTHIRLLAFSPAPIVECSIRINAQDWQACTSVNGNLFVARWQPDRDYADGLHRLEVRVRDRVGRERHVEQPFSLDGTRVTFDLLARLVLMSDASVVFRWFFGVAVSVCVVPLCFFRAWHELTVRGRVARPRFQRFTRSVCRRFWILSSVNRLCVPIVVYCLYLTVGPWSFGEVIDGHFGIVFSWGIYVNGGYVPSSLTYLYGSFQLALCQLPLIFIFANMVDERYRQKYFVAEVEEERRSLSQRWLNRYCRHAPFVMIVGIEVVLALLFWHMYGMLAFCIGPFRTWSLVMNIALWFVANTLPDKCYRYV